MQHQPHPGLYKPVYLGAHSSNTLISFLPHLKTLLKWCTTVGLKSKPLLSCPKIPVCHSTNPVPKDSNPIAQPCWWACLYEKYIIFSFGGMYNCKDTKSATNSPECGISIYFCQDELTSAVRKQFLPVNKHMWRKTENRYFIVLCSISGKSWLEESCAYMSKVATETKTDQSLFWYEYNIIIDIRLRNQHQLKE